MTELTIEQPIAPQTNSKHSQHYSERYFAWQKTVGEFGGWANTDKFQSFIEPSDKVVDFGSGGGFLLNQLVCGEKIGIEINPVAVANAQKLGIHSEFSAEGISSEWADVIVSNHALEHTQNPLGELEQLKRILKPGGKMVFVVPSETIKAAYRPDDINFHLYTWGPANLGNLFTEAGFKVIESRPYLHKWPPFKKPIARLFGRRGFNFFSRIRAHLDRRDFQVRIIAIKPEH